MHLTQVFKNFDTGNVMKIIALLGFLCGCVAAQSQSDGKVIGDRAPATAPLEIGVGQQAAAMIDCTRTFECELVSYDPVCGSDGITFANDCVFASTFCSEENDPNTLFIQAAGVCPSFPEDNGEEAPDASSTTPSSSIPDENELQSSDQTESTTEVDLKTVFCSLTCKLTPDQVCGTDGVTYINDCHLLSSKCEHPGLKKAAHGECAPDKEANAVLNVLEVHSETTTNEVLTTPPEKCNPMCERIYDPICGSDGITYANSCLLEYAECRNPSIKVFGAGKCPPHMVAARSASASTNTNGGESCVPGPCPYTYAPVCGSDGQTHENLCLFANAWCQHPQHALKVLHDGECDADTQITCETMTCPSYTECREQIEPDSTVVAYCADICSPDRCSEREDCELIDSDCFTAPCSPVAMCIPKIQEG